MRRGYTGCSLSIVLVPGVCTDKKNTIFNEHPVGSDRQEVS